MGNRSNAPTPSNAARNCSPRSIPSGTTTTSPPWSAARSSSLRISAARSVADTSSVSTASYSSASRLPAVEDGLVGLDSREEPVQCRPSRSPVGLRERISGALDELVESLHGCVLDRERAIQDPVAEAIVEVLAVEERLGRDGRPADQQPVDDRSYATVRAGLALVYSRHAGRARGRLASRIRRWPSVSADGRRLFPKERLRGLIGDGFEERLLLALVLTLKSVGRLAA